tara:strand:- start:10315 stop:10965 length:651 start_codon:yes stop_codon:yes gene_type:complete
MARPKKIDVSNKKAPGAHAIELNDQVIVRKDAELRERERLLSEREEKLSELEAKVSESEAKLSELKSEDAAIIDKVIDEAMKVSVEVPVNEMPLESIRDYRLYNERVRKINKKARSCVHLIKQCPVELHPMTRIVFQRNDQPENQLPVYVSNHLIHFEKTLFPGQTYDLPNCIVHYLADKGYPVWKWVERPDGSRYTTVSHKTPRFALRTIYEEAV